MKNDFPPIKWTGSKRYLSQLILQQFPCKINTYFEPFLGGGSIFLALLNSSIFFNKIVASDINQDLMNLWFMIKLNHKELGENYEKLWLQLNSLRDEKEKNSFFKEQRCLFNKTKCPFKFYFLNRTSFNGLVRYNKKGEFNSPYHIGRPGSNPTLIKKCLDSISKKINKFDIEFKTASYENILGEAGLDDFVFFDPPYFDTKGIYSCGISVNDLINNLNRCKSGFVLSYDGTRNEKSKIDLPSTLYSYKVLTEDSISGFSKLKNVKDTKVKESIYVKKI